MFMFFLVRVSYVQVILEMENVLEMIWFELFYILCIMFVISQGFFDILLFSYYFEDFGELKYEFFIFENMMFVEIQIF